MRLDQWMTLRGHAPSRSKAKELIESGAVLLKLNEEWITATSASQKITDTTEIKITETSVLKYVSRGGLKLEGALKDFSISVQDFKVFDVGQSTGGFTDCLLHYGAKEVLGIDVGHGQLHQSLKEDPRVTSLEGIHISRLNEHREVIDWLDKGFDLCVIDVSFISILKVFEALSAHRFKGYKVLALIKPQFEVGKSALSKGGVVKDSKILTKCLAFLESEIKDLGFEVIGKLPSQIKGADGNQEYFFYCTSL